MHHKKSSFDAAQQIFLTCMHLEMSSDHLLSELGFLKMYNFSAAHISSWSASFVRVSSLQQFRGNIVVYVLTFQFPHFLWYFCTVVVFIVCKRLYAQCKWTCQCWPGARVYCGTYEAAKFKVHLEQMQTASGCTWSSCNLLQLAFLLPSGGFQSTLVFSNN